jgi:hypothetical protein
LPTRWEKVIGFVND